MNEHPQGVPRFLVAMISWLVASGCTTVSPSPQNVVTVTTSYNNRQIEVPLEPSDNEHCRKAVGFLAAHDWNSAKQEFTAALEGDPQDHRAHFGLGLACEKLGDKTAAASNYQKAVGLVPDQTVYKAALKRLQSQ